MTRETDRGGGYGGLASARSRSTKRLTARAPPLSCGAALIPRRVSPAQAKSSDIATIMYTSGTTGSPKGVILPHSALVSEIHAVGALLAAVGCDISSSDIFFSYLPLAHIFDRMIEELFIAMGGCVGYVNAHTHTHTRTHMQSLSLSLSLSLSCTHTCTRSLSLYSPSILLSFFSHSSL